MAAMYERISGDQLAATSQQIFSAVSSAFHRDMCLTESVMESEFEHTFLRATATAFGVRSAGTSFPKLRAKLWDWWGKQCLAPRCEQIGREAIEEAALASPPPVDEGDLPRTVMAAVGAEAPECLSSAALRTGIYRQVQNATAELKSAAERKTDSRNAAQAVEPLLRDSTATTVTITANSEGRPEREAQFARYSDAGWCAGHHDNPWLEVDLGATVRILEVGTLGTHPANFVRRYNLLYRTAEATTFETVVGLLGGTDADTEHRNEIDIFAAVVRIEPVEYTGAPCLRLELYTDPLTAVKHQFSRKLDTQSRHLSLKLDSHWQESQQISRKLDSHLHRLAENCYTKTTQTCHEDNKGDMRYLDRTRDAYCADTEVFMGWNLVRCAHWGYHIHFRCCPRI
eukprot:TRINITY_DN19811_c0_g1_i2.p1 TRINITY_DN19811_c0_g1~~TRINITY_DN19811_c0_g1_i2.p1  ORF type:complete len:399 (-),score=59.01 TRINITY_DN19811_c0_g1_i2:13-1209(-)